MAAYLGQITRITRNDGYVPEMREYKLNGKKQVEEWLSEVRAQFLGIYCETDIPQAERKEGEKK